MLGVFLNHVPCLSNFFFLERFSQDPKHANSSSQQATRPSCLHFPSPVLALLVHSIMLVNSLFLMIYQFFKNFMQCAFIILTPSLNSSKIHPSSLLI